MVPRIIETPVRLLQHTAASYINDNGSRLAAALAYYSVFALPSLLVIVVTLFGQFVAPSMVKGEIAAQMNVIVGPEAAQ